MIWVQLQRSNDWGVEYLSVRPLSRFKTASQRRAYRLDAGDSVDVRLRDGSERRGVIALRDHHTMVSDHGHSYPVSYRLPFVRLPEGTQVDLLECEIRYERDRDPTAGEA